jgi:hypothetical protein
MSFLHSTSKLSRQIRKDPPAAHLTLALLCSMGPPQLLPQPGLVSGDAGMGNNGRKRGAGLVAQRPPGAVTREAPPPVPGAISSTISFFSSLSLRVPQYIFE